MKKLVTLFAMVAFAVSSFAQEQWTIDPYHSSLNFTIQHSGISMVNGKFMDYTGTLTTKGDELTKAEFAFTVQIKSINTNVEKRDDHLRSADFFEVEKYPTMTFESTKIQKAGKSDQYLLYGNLTIKGVTKQVVFDLEYGGKVSSQQGEKMGFYAQTAINRFDYNIDYDPTATGIGKDVHIEVHLQFAKQ